LFYVVDELLNEDQRTIMHLVENAALEKSDQQIAIIHNWKRIDCTKTGEVQKMVKGQIIGPFAAKEAHANERDRKLPNCVKEVKATAANKGVFVAQQANIPPLAGCQVP
jgi:hypothetical protein